jgi:signal transduction histidine kinase/HAMP domain-containing protein
MAQRARAAGVTGPMRVHGSRSSGADAWQSANADSAGPAVPPVPVRNIGAACGMRGGLGKTLLLAFLLLAIVPLSLLAFFTYHQIQRVTRQHLVASLETMVALKEAHLVDFVQGYERELALLARASGLEGGGLGVPLSPSSQSGAFESSGEGAEGAVAQILVSYLEAFQATDPTLTGLVLLDSAGGDLIASATRPDLGIQIGPQLLKPLAEGQRLLIVPEGGVGGQPLVAVGYAWQGGHLVGLLSWESLSRVVTDSEALEEGVKISLVTAEGLMISSQDLALPSLVGEGSAFTGVGTLPEATAQAFRGQTDSGAYVSLEAVPVFGAYRWSQGLQAALLAEVAETEALATGNTLTAVVEFATLAVALITAAIAALVTRRLTVPIVQLTQTAAWMARGDLNQQVIVNRTDEIGVLARAFNRMAAELRILYANLEAKVAERTQQLEEATERISYHATRLTLSAEVARVVTSIRDLDVLLPAVAELIGNAFELHYVAIYLLDDASSTEPVLEPVAEWAVRQAGSMPLSDRHRVGGNTLIGRVVSDGERRLARAVKPGPADSSTVAEGSMAAGGLPVALEPPVACELAVALRTRQKVLGVLDLQSIFPDVFDANDQMVYQSLADQISIAIENAQAYAVERETVKRLRELDRIQAEFLTNMSHALRTPLNSIIGFSRIMLKGLDGPLSDLQRTDLAAIHQSGRQLLGLINDMLELSHLELGTAAFSLAAVDLAEIIEGVMATARALARGKPVQLYQDVPADLPLLRTDGQRVRQVILALLTNAVKNTDKGSIRLSVMPENGRISISVRDTGVSIPQAERDRLFSDSHHGESQGQANRPSRAGGPSSASSLDGEDVPDFGLALSKRVVEKLGGQIWLESKEGVGSTFTFTLPTKPADVEPI